MADFDNTNRGILSKNDRREKDSHPEYNGTINIEGREYWLSAWVKERKDGSGKFFSLAVKPKDEKAAPKRDPERQAAIDKLADDCPF